MAAKRQEFRDVGDEKERRTYLGGSDAAAALGVSPWRSPYQLWCEKTGIESPPDLSFIDYIYFGHLLEPIVAQVFTERLEMKLRVTRKLYRHPKYPFLAGHIDRLILNEKAFVECKTANSFDYSKWGKTEGGPDDIPVQYLAQVDHYMMIMGCTHCYVSALIGGSDFRWYRIERNKKREQVLLDACRNMWDMIQKDKPPDITNERDSKHRWKEVMEGTSVAVDLDARKKIIRLSRVTEDRKKLDKEEKELRNWLFPLFQDKEIISESGEPLCSLSSFPRKYVDDKALAEKYPKIVAKFTEPRITKRLKILI